MAVQVIHDGESSVVTDNGDGTVTKRYKDTYRHLEDFEREAAHYLRHEYGFGVEIAVDARAITMDHLGHPIQPDTMPRDWRERAEALLWTMRGAEIQHNDIRPDNLLVYEGSLVLIDWQWWTPLGVAPPHEWPPRLGGDWRAGGEAATLKLTRKPQRDYDQTVEIWFAPSMDYLPVRSRITQQNGDFIDQQLRVVEKP